MESEGFANCHSDFFFSSAGAASEIRTEANLVLRPWYNVTTVIDMLISSFTPLHFFLFFPIKANATETVIKLGLGPDCLLF